MIEELEKLLLSEENDVCLYILGNFYMEGENYGIETDLNKSLNYLERSKNLGNTSSSALYQRLNFKMLRDLSISHRKYSIYHF